MAFFHDDNYIASPKNRYKELRNDVYEDESTTSVTLSEILFKDMKSYYATNLKNSFGDV